MTTSENSGLVFNIHRLSSDDGPGLRDTFFLKGCALRCEWCHNPESLNGQREVWWNKSKCIGQLECISHCPTKALSFSSQGISIDRNRCEGCGICVNHCSAMAMEPLGKKWTVDEIANEALKDKLFFQNSGGGVTLSGGEPLFQGPFVMELLQRLKKDGLHTALDTCGFLLHSYMEKLLPLVDLFLYDLKEMDAELHQRWTGVSNEPILQNLKNLIQLTHRQKNPAEIWIRTPLIPQRTATQRNIQALGAFIKENSQQRITRWELCAFNNICGEKYARLGRPWALANEALLDRNLGAELLALAEESSGLSNNVRLTGLI